MFLVQSQSYHFFGNFGESWSKILLPGGQIENLIFLGQNISFKGKHTKNLEFQCNSRKMWFLVLDSNK